MKNYYDNKEMDKSWNEEDYLEIAEYQNNKLSQKDIEYTEFLCWILEQRDWENDIMIIKGNEYDRFMESDNNDDEEMDMKIVESDNFYNQFKEITNVDIMNENNFVSMKYISRNDINLILRANGMNQRFVIGV